MTEEKNEFTKQEVFDEFVSTMHKSFKSEEAEGISFTVGNYVNDYDVAIIFTVDDGKLDSRAAEGLSEVEACDIFLSASLNIFTRIDQKELAFSELMEVEGEDIYFGGDMGLIYELYNIFDLPA